ncbi:hypothetical protein SBRCBS47491_005468 [Sporothrix bragantina]|uniref:Uncharacterized protein n=1 Tax=Sporothrix bragantina TaxID=671064 RepID=A0ABP0BX82_9PEZI
MGQNCCKPCGASYSRRLARVKAEAAAATDATAHPANLPPPDPSVAQLLRGSNVSLQENVPQATTTAAAMTISDIALSGLLMPTGAVPTPSTASAAPCGPPQPDGSSDVRIAAQEDNGDEDDGQHPPPPPQRHIRKDSRGWLHRQRMRLAMARKLGHRHRNHKQKVAIAQDEAPVSSRHPIITIMASSDDGQSDENGGRGPLVVGEERRMTQSPELVSSHASRPSPQLLAPTPRRPMTARFPFLNQATISVDTARSSNESHPSMTPSTVITTQQPVVEDAGERGPPREVHRNSLRSSSPSIYYLAPTSPEMVPVDRTSVDERLAINLASPAEVPLADSCSTSEPHTSTEEPFLSTVLSYVTAPWQRPWSVTPV